MSLLNNNMLILALNSRLLQEVDQNWSYRFLLSACLGGVSSKSNMEVLRSNILMSVLVKVLK